VSASRLRRGAARYLLPRRGREAPQAPGAKLPGARIKRFLERALPD